MSVTLVDNVFPLTTDELRMFMRDQPNYNILLDDIQFVDKEILLAQKLTLAKWNAVTPVSNLTSADQLNEYVLLCGVCGLLFKSEGIRSVRNQLMTQDGAIAPVGIDEKEALYMKWAMHFQDEFLRMAQAIKIQQNMESLLSTDMSSGFGSGYRYIGKYAR